MINKYLYNIRFLFSDLSINHKSESKYVMYDKHVEYRRLQAQRSVLIEIQSYKSCNDIYQYCSEFGAIRNIFFYSIGINKRHFVYIEFASKFIVDKIISDSTYMNLEEVIPVRSSNFWFRKMNLQQNKNFETPTHDFLQHIPTLKTDSEIVKILRNSTDVSDQILLLYKATKLTDEDVRLRYYIAYQFERSFHGLFPNIAILPFGSSVNGFGVQNCDLDIALVFDDEKREKIKSRLMFHSKYYANGDKRRLKKIMEVIADVMNVFIPGAYNIKKILEAKVPILKFDYSLVGIECDLSMSNKSGCYMSELLHMYGEMDTRVRPLIFTIRKWARNHNITKSMAGPWITNFSLTLMTLFFFQYKKILPPVSVLQKYVHKNDIRLVESQVDYTFQRDLSKLPKNDILNNDSLEILLKEFFTYYRKFDFETQAISLQKGTPYKKPLRCPVYINNPFDSSLNVSKNVKYEEIQRLKHEMNNALLIMEKEEFKSLGLINLIISKKNRIQNENKPQIEKNVDVNKNIDVNKILQNDSAVV